MGRRAPSIDCFCWRDHWWNALPAPCCVFSDAGGGAYLEKLALKSDSTVNFENCTSNSPGALGSTGKLHDERSRQGVFCTDLGCSRIMRSACLTSLLRRWFVCRGGGGGGEQHYEFPGLPRNRERLSSSNEPTQLQFSPCMRWRVVTVRFAHAFGIFE